MKNKQASELSVGVITHNYPSSENDRQNAGIFIYDIVSYLSHKIHISVLAPSEKNIQEKINNVSVSWFSWGINLKLGSLQLWKPQDMKKFLEFFYSGEKASFNYVSVNPSIKVIVAMWAFPAGYFAYRLKRKFKIPYIIWALGSDIYIYGKMPILKILVKKILVNADVVYADGIDLASEVKKLSGVNCIFLPSASQFGSKPQNKTASSHLKKYKNVITFLGRMESVKGPDILLDAIILSKDFLQNYQINYIGDGSLLEGLKIRAENAGLSDKIVFHGNISDAIKIKSILEESKWIVIPSRSDSIPLVFSESMKAGSPIIAADLPDLKYLVNKYDIGVCFKANSAGDLARVLSSIDKLNSSHDKFKKNTANAAKIFSVDSSGDILLKSIQRLIK